MNLRSSVQNLPSSLTERVLRYYLQLHGEMATFATADKCLLCDPDKIGTYTVLKDDLAIS